MKHLLFSYGTLQFPKVQKETFGRKLAGKKDSLSRYRIEKLTIKDQNVLKLSKELEHPIAVFTGDEKDQIQGVIYEITDKELEHVDAYEVSDYRRIEETFKSGSKAWVFVK